MYGSDYTMRGMPRWLNSAEDVSNTVQSIHKSEWCEVMPQLCNRHPEWMKGTDTWFCDSNMPASVELSMEDISPTLYTFQLLTTTEVNLSPYKSVALPVHNAYEFFNYDYGVSLSKKGFTSKVLPMTYFNRIVGAPPDTEVAEKQKFIPIKGLDLFDTQGALTDFYESFKVALVRARQMGSAVFFDPEHYNNYSNAWVPYISAVKQIPETTVISAIEAIAIELVNLIEKYYPTAIIISYFIDIGVPRSVAYLFRKMLEEAKARYSLFTIVAGDGCPPILDNNGEATIQAKMGYWQPYTSEYPHLKLGAELLPWHDASLRTGAYTKGIFAESPFQNLADFVPAMRLAFQNFDYVWVYAASGVGYNPSDPKIAPLYNAAIREAMA